MLLPARKECTRMLIVNLRCTDERYLYIIAGSSRDFDHGAAWTVMTYIVGSYSISKSRNAEAADNLIIVRLSVKPQKYLSRGSFLGSSFFLTPVHVCMNTYAQIHNQHFTHFQWKKFKIWRTLRENE
jgi:hypothetical protein